MTNKIAAVETMPFVKWVARVEQEVGSDVDGESYRRYYDQGLSPSEAVLQDRLNDGVLDRPQASKIPKTHLIVKGEHKLAVDAATAEHLSFRGLVSKDADYDSFTSQSEYAAKFTVGELHAWSYVEQAIKHFNECRTLSKGDPLDLLTRLVQWSESMGGSKAPVWQEAAEFVRDGQAALKAPKSPRAKDGPDWTVRVEMGVTATSPEEAARFALDDIRDLDLEAINLDVENLASGRIKPVTIKN
jgi:hypothetical protein